MEIENDIRVLTGLFQKELSSDNPKIIPLTGGGSNRKYYRMTSDDTSIIGVIARDIQENEAFLNLCSLLYSQGIRVPKIIAVSAEKDAYIISDLGNTDLLSLLKGDEKLTLAKKALEELIIIQSLPEKLWIDKVIFPPFSKRLVMWDLNYFKYDFLKPEKVLFDEEALEDDFEKLTFLLLEKEMNGFMYRDFQSRNIMVKDRELWFIDFQGGRKGPLTYDAASFIWQAKAPFSFDEREELMRFYVKKISESKNFEPKEVETQLKLMIIFRTLQVLGAYGFRGLIERKPHFIESIPYAVKNLSYMREKGWLKDFPEIAKISKQLEKDDDKREKDKVLTVSVFSYSYKKGYPEDKSGNGGGFMFDCRGIHNPGRYEEYKDKTGIDEEVINFLETKTDAGSFVEKAVEIVSPTIETYVGRGFTSLQVGFGCTGGQHRSVYCAEKFASIITKKYPGIKVRVNHRERGITKVL